MHWDFRVRGEIITLQHFVHRAFRQIAFRLDFSPDPSKTLVPDFTHLFRYVHACRKFTADVIKVIPGSLQFDPEVLK